MSAEIQQEDLNIVLPIISTIKPKVIVDIGTYFGGSAILWRDTYKPDILITVDILQRVPKIEGAEYIIGNSRDTETLGLIAKALEGREIDLLFIDGDHAYEAVKADFESLSPLVRQGGIIMFHDIIYSTPVDDVPPFWKETKKKYNYIEIAQNNNTTGVGIITMDKPYERTHHGNAV